MVKTVATKAESQNPRSPEPTRRNRLKLSSDQYMCIVATTHTHKHKIFKKPGCTADQLCNLVILLCYLVFLLLLGLFYFLKMYLITYVCAHVLGVCA